MRCMLAVLGMLFAQVAFGQIDRSQLPEPTAQSVWTPPDVTVWKLDNGLAVWHVEQRHTPLVTFSLVLPRGSAIESPDLAGQLSLMVDLMDEGAAGRSALELSAEMQRLAMDFSGVVQVDATTFSMNILSEKLDESLAVFADILLKPTFDAEDFERRKAQRIASAISSEADQGRTAFRALGRSMFGEGYLGLPSFGTKSTIKKITLEGVKSVYPQVITPKHGTLVVVGAVDKATLDAAIKKAGLAAWGKTDQVSEQVAESTKAVDLKQAPLQPSRTSSSVPTMEVVDFPGSSQTFLIVAKPTQGTDAVDRYDAQVFNHGFAGSFTSRVNLNLREDKGYTYGARGGFYRNRLAGKYVLYAKVKRDTTRASLDEIFSELTQVSANKPVSQLERDNAVNGLLKGFPGQFERGGALAGKLVGLATNGQTPDELKNWPNQISAVSLSAARGAAKIYANVNDFTVVIAGDWSKISDSLKDLKRTVVMRTAEGTLVETK